MYVDLLNNLAVTSAFLFIAGRLIRNHPLELINLSFKIKIYLGIGFGLLGILLMLSHIQVTDDIIVDLRHLAIIIAAILGGPIAAIITGMMIGITRLVLFGISTTSFLASIVACSMGIIYGYGYTSRVNIPNIIKYVIMNISYVFISTIIIYVRANDSSIAYRTFANYWTVSIIGAIFTYYIIEYIKTSNEDRRSILYYKLMADNSLDLIATHQLDGTFKYVSPSSLSVVGYYPEQLLGKKPYDFYHTDDLIKIQKSHSTVRDTPSESLVSYRFKHKDGRYIWLETTSKRIKHSTSEADEIITVSRDVTVRMQIEEELLNANEKLQQISLLDGLTDIPNRRGFDQRIEEEWQRALRNVGTLSLIMFDVDYFKRYNDEYGHHLGDECLKKIAKTAQSSLNRPTDYLARYGGEEFAIILPNTDHDGAFIVAEYIRQAVERLSIPHSNSKIMPIVTISAGVATRVPSTETKYLELILSADETLYRAKQEGRNRVL